MYSSSRSRSSNSSSRSWSSDRKPFERKTFERKTFERKPYAGKPRPEYDARSARPERGPDPRQMRYQVIGRTTDESDLIVQISPAFYEYVRSMAHQWTPAPRIREQSPEQSSPRYNKFDHPYHKEPMYGKDRWQQENRRWPIGDRSERPTATKESWYKEDSDMSDIDSEMDNEYTMIKDGFAKLHKEKVWWPKRSTPKTNRKKS